MTMLTTTKLIINLDNGQGIQTQDNSASDLAGLVNAGAQKIYSCTDLFTGHAHDIVVSHITDFYEANV